MNGMSEKAGEIMRTVDKLDKIGAEKVRQLLIDEVKMLPCKAENVLGLHGDLRHERGGHLIP
jgi:hypothetical protein